MAFSVHTFETNPDDANLSFAFHEKTAEGQEIFFLSRFHKDTKNANSIAEALFGSIVNILNTSRISDPYDKFEEALKSANSEARKYQIQMSNIPDIAIAFFDFNNLYLSQAGLSEAYLIREGNISQISETPEDDNDIFQNILNGHVALKDTIILSSTRLLRVVTSTQLTKIFSHSDFGHASSLLKDELTSASSDGILATIIGIGQKEETPSAGFLSRILKKKDKIAPPPVALPESDTNEPQETTNDSEEDPIDPLQDYKAPHKPEEEQKTEETENQEKVHNYDNTPDESLDEDYPDPLANTHKGPSITQKISNITSKLNFRPKKNMAIIAIAILITLGGIIGIKKINFESETTKILREQLSSARKDFQQADILLVQGNRTQAATFLQKARVATQEILKSKSKDFRSDAQVLLAGIEDKQLQVENAREITPVLLADIGIKNDSVQANSILALRGNLFVHDAKKLYKTIRNIVEKGLQISEKETIQASTVRKDQKTLVFLTDSPRIVEYRDGIISPMGTTDDTWKKGIDIKTYGKYTYFLDPVENQIWKYERRRDNYSGAIPYNQGADLSRAISFGIDGAIYVLSDDGTLQKLFRGEQVEYAFRDLPTVQFNGKNLKIFTRTDLDFLYILDPDNSRILVFVKGERLATYKKQIIYNVPDARDFVVDDLGQKVNLLTKSKIYEFSL